MSGSEGRYPGRDPSTGRHLQALNSGQLESISHASAVSQGHYATVAPRGNQSKVLLPVDFGTTRGSSPHHGKGEPESCRAAAIPRNATHNLQKTQPFFDLLDFNLCSQTTA